MKINEFLEKYSQDKFKLVEELIQYLTELNVDLKNEKTVKYALGKLCEDDQEADNKSLQAFDNTLYEILIYISFVHSVNTELHEAKLPSEWDYSTFNQLQNAVEENLEDETKDKILQYLNYLKMARPLWQVKINPVAYQNSESIALAKDKLLPSYLGTEDAKENVMMDILRLNGRVENNQFVTDLYLDNNQLVFDVSQKENDLNILKNDKDIKDHWNKLVHMLTRNENLDTIIYSATNQKLATHLPTNAMQELQRKQMLTLNEASDLGHIFPSIYIKVTNDTVIYQCNYICRDKKENLVYILTGDVSIKNTSNENKYSLELNNIEIKGYSKRAKYIFPTLHNRGYLEQQLKTIQINHVDPEIVKIREAAETVADTLSCHGFEQLVDKLMSYAKDKDNFDNEFMLDLAKDSVRDEVSNIIKTIYTPDSYKNKTLINSYLNDMPDGENKNRLMQVANENSEQLSLLELNTFLAQSTFQIEQSEQYGQDESIYSITQIINTENKLSHIRKLYLSLNENERIHLNEKIEIYLNSIELNANIDSIATQQISMVAQQLIIETVLHSTIDKMSTLSEEQKNQVNNRIVGIASLILKRESALFKKYRLFGDENQFWENFDEIKDYILEQCIKLNDNEISEDIVLEASIKIVINKRLKELGIIDKQIKTKIDEYADIIKHIGLSWLPTSTWMTSKDTIIEFINIIHKNKDKDKDKNGIATEARSYITAQLIKNDFIKKIQKKPLPRINMTAIPDFYSEVILNDINITALKIKSRNKKIDDNEAGIIAINELAHRIVEEIGDKPLAFENIRHQMASQAMDKCFTPSAHPFSYKTSATTYLLGQKNILMDGSYQIGTLPPFKPTNDQAKFLVKMEALNTLYLPPQASGRKNEDAAHSDKIFNQYLLDMEKKARTDFNQGTEQQKEIARKKLNVINQYCYANKNSTLYFNSVIPVQNMLDDNHLVLKDFNKNWLKSVNDIIGSIIKGTNKMDNPLIENQLAKLINLKNEGRVFIDNLGRFSFIAKFFLNKKLNTLDKFINDIKRTYSEREGMRVLHKIYVSKKTPHLDLKMKKTRLMEFVQKEKNVFAQDNVGNSLFSLFKNENSQINHDNELKNAIKQLGEEIVEARITQAGRKV